MEDGVCKIPQYYIFCIRGLERLSLRFRDHMMIFVLLELIVVRQDLNFYIK
jgi:hypothetical protein